MEYALIDDLVNKTVELEELKMESTLKKNINLFFKIKSISITKIFLVRNDLILYLVYI